MNQRLTVAISDMKISKRSGDVLVTHSLGSCLGLAAYDPLAMVGGLIHCLLPKSTHREVTNPYMYVNVGVPDMIRQLLALGASKAHLRFKAAGCASMMGIQNQFDTGAHNLAMLEALFAKNNVVLAARDVGGSIPRTVALHMETGVFTIRSQGKEWQI